MKTIMNKISKGISQAGQALSDAHLKQKTQTAYQVTRNLIEKNTLKSVKNKRPNAVYLDLKNHMTPQEYSVFRTNNPHLNLPE